VLSPTGMDVNRRFSSANRQAAPGVIKMNMTEKTCRVSLAEAPICRSAATILTKSTPTRYQTALAVICSSAVAAMMPRRPRLNGVEDVNFRGE